MSEKPGLRLVSAYREKSYPYTFTIPLHSELEDEVYRDIGFIHAVRLYVTQKTNELNITDYRAFAEDDHMNVLFRNSADYEDFKASYENRVNTVIRLKLTFPGKVHEFQLQNILREFEGLAYQFRLEHEVRFEIDRKNRCLNMTAINREAFLTFFQEYEYVRGRMSVNQVLEPDSLVPLLGS